MSTLRDFFRHRPVLTFALRTLAWKLPLAYAALIPAHVWGIFFKFKMTVNVLAHPEIAAQIGMSHFAKTLLVLGNQFGYLMLPVISTALFWLLMNLDFVRSLQDEYHRQSD